MSKSDDIPPVPVSIRAVAAFLKPYKLQGIGAITALLVTTAVTLAIGQGVRLVIDKGFVTGSLSQLNQTLLLLLAFALILAAGSYVRFYLMSWIGERVSADIRRRVFDHMIAMHPGFFETNRSGEIISRLTTDTTLLQSIIGSAFSMALRGTLSGVGALAMMLFTNLRLSIIILLAVPLILLPIRVFGRRVRRLSRHSQDSVAEIGNYAGEAFQNIKTVQSYTREDWERQSFAREVETAFNVATRRIRQRALLMAAVILLVFVALITMLWVGGRDVMTGAMTPGELGAFVFYALLVALGAATLSEVYGELQRAVGATERLMDLLRARPLIAGNETATEASTLPADLALENVTFSYPSRPEHPALENLSLAMPRGQITALVGPSGAGKSTIFELLQRFYDPDEGRITLGDTDIRGLDPQDLRQQFALVPQQPAIFSADVLYNIRYGRPDASDEEVAAAARAANAHDFIVRLPQGYRSHLGERGVRLSGGQKQRLAIARAILRNPRILLLDEATSALDSESEQQVQAALHTLMSNRTTLIIAHRLATVLHADRIAVLDEGRLIALGSHTELLDTCPLYFRLAELQFQDKKSPKQQDS
jgi:ATP-binding cassette subfamily B protein